MVAGGAELPFPIAELSWERFGEAQAAMDLSADKTKSLLSMVLGEPPDGFVPRIMIQHMFSGH